MKLLTLICYVCYLINAKYDIQLTAFERIESEDRRKQKKWLLGKNKKCTKHYGYL